jgi:hypothetical protein
MDQSVFFDWNYGKIRCKTTLIRTIMRFSLSATGRKEQLNKLLMSTFLTRLLVLNLTPVVNNRAFRSDTNYVYDYSFPFSHSDFL